VFVMELESALPFFRYRFLGKYDRLGCFDERSCLLSSIDI
jgi:hypothetical protein